MTRISDSTSAGNVSEPWAGVAGTLSKRFYRGPRPFPGGPVYFPHRTMPRTREALATMAKASKNAILLADRRMTGEAEQGRSKFDLYMDAITTANIRPARVKFLSPKPIRCCAYQSGMACLAWEELVVLDVSVLPSDDEAFLVGDFFRRDALSGPG